MAKKVIKKDGELPDVFSMVKGIDDSVEIIEDSAYSNIDAWIPTGNYLLNAAISGSIFGGIPSGRVTTLVGEPGTAKSYLACSIVREAQKLGYTGIYMDSEGAIDSAFVSRLGVDPKKLIIKQVNTVLEVSHFVINLCEELTKQQEEYGKTSRIVLILDSLGNLSSESERSNTMAGENKADLKRAQAVKQLFRTCMVPLAKNHVPFIVVSHVYASMSMYSPGSVVSGGSGINYNSSVTLELSASKINIKDDNSAQNAANADDVLKAGVIITAKPKKSRFTISRKVRFSIPFFKKPNPYIGLTDYIDWERGGMCRGTFLTEKEYNKLSDADKEKKCHVFEFNGETKYVQEKDTARNIIVRHLGKAVPITELFTDEVFTDEYLREIDEKIIKPSFELPDQSSFDDVKEIEDMIEIDSAEESAE